MLKLKEKQLNEPEFSRNELNPLTELAELRLAVVPDNGEFDVRSQLRFSTAEVCFKNREYRVGISEARLQLYLEGWETALGCDFGDIEIAPTTEETTVQTQASVGATVEVPAQLDGQMSPKAKLSGGVGKAKNQSLQTNRVHYPMVALPNNAWKIKAPPAGNSDRPALEGSAISGEALCRLQKRSGGNRLSLTAELQVRRANITVSPTKGNAWGKVFSLSNNKDAVVAKVLERALRREASTIPQGAREGTVVVSKSEWSEV